MLQNVPKKLNMCCRMLSYNFNKFDDLNLKNFKMHYKTQQLLKLG